MFEQVGSKSLHEAQEYGQREAVIERLSAEIVADPAKEQLYRDFMWEQIGEPDPALRGTNKEPYPMEVWDSELHVYSTYEGGFYGDNGDLVSVRSVEPLEGHGDRPKDYYVAVTHLASGRVEVPIVHTVRQTPEGRRIQLIDAAAYENSPPSNRAGVHAPAYDQWRLMQAPGKPVELIYGRVRPIQQLYPVEALAARVNERLIERDGQLEVVRAIGATALGTALHTID